MLLDFTLLGFSMAFMRQGITQIYLREKIVPNIIEIWCINKIRSFKRVDWGNRARVSFHRFLLQNIRNCEHIVRFSLGFTQGKVTSYSERIRKTD